MASDRYRLVTMLGVSLACLLACLPIMASAAELTVFWSDNSSGMASFRVERRAWAETAFNTVADLSARTTTYRDTNVVAGATYCYRVKAYYLATESPYSNEACASPIASTYTVTVTRVGAGTGVVASTPPGLQCGTDCVASFPAGSIVTLVSTAAPGSVFAGWTGGCAGTASCTLAANAPVSVTAQFSPLVDLTVSTLGRGTVASSPVGIRCGTSCSKTFVSGSRITLTATPANGFHFSGWTGGCSGAGLTCTVQLSNRTAVSATFRNGGGNIGGPKRR
jgi:hypothetical protein